MITRREANNIFLNVASFLIFAEALAIFPYCILKYWIEPRWSWWGIPVASACIGIVTAFVGTILVMWLNDFWAAAEEIDKQKKKERG